MSITRYGLVLAGVLGTTLLTAGRPAVRTILAEKYFGCPSGYSFQTSGNNARCYLASTATANIQCGLGYVKTIDQFNSGKDGCQHQMSNTVSNYTCQSGYQPQVQAGPDVCVKTPSIIAPQVEKSL